LNALFAVVNNRGMSDKKVEDLWVHLHWLTVLSQQGSYTASAQRLGVSKAAMSQRISELERAAGVALVQRTTRSVRLTEAGQQLVAGMRDPFERIAQSFSSVRDLADEPAGLIRVTAPVALARQQLVPRIAEFARAHPRVRLELDMSDRLNSLATEGFDLAIRHTASPPDTHVAWPLCSTRSVLVATRDYLRRHGTPASPLDLAQHDCLHYPRAQDTPAWHFLPPEGRRKAQRQRVTVPVSGPFCANNSEALRDAAISGLGIALLPDFSAQAALQSGKLVEVLADWASVGTFSHQIYAIRPYASHVPRSVSAFVAWLRAVWADGFGVRI
jgi:DNA-binding transcriptional LysR family regulator